MRRGLIFGFVAFGFLLIVSVLLFSSSVNGLLGKTIGGIQDSDSAFCTDSDSGVKITEKGFVRVSKSCETHEEDDSLFGIKSLFKGEKDCVETYRDFCLDDSTLREYSCFKASASYEDIVCKNGCAEGRCLSKAYIVVASDTEARCDGTRHETCDFSNYENPESVTGEIFDSAFRQRNLDSFGNPFKMTWYTYTSASMCEGNNTDCLSIYSHLTDSFEDEIGQYGDGIEWHFHNEYWKSYGSCWSQSLRFFSLGRSVAEKILNHFLLDKGFFPSSYRGGWVWENTQFSNFLEDMLFSDYSNLAPLANVNPGESKCVGNIYDWSLAPDTWEWYHPNDKNYQLAGNQDRTMFRCVQFLDESAIEDLFSRASDEEVSVGCIYLHNVKENVPEQLDMVLSSYVYDKSIQYDIPFEYVTAQEAAKIALNREEDIISPGINLLRNGLGVKIYSDEEVYGVPYVAVKREEIYERLEVTPIGDYFYFELPIEWDSFGVAVTDLAGNVNVKKEVNISK